MAALATGIVRLMLAVSGVTVAPASEQEPVIPPSVVTQPAAVAPQTAQTTPTVTERPDPERRTERPLSAEEQRERLIRLYDPKSGVDPRGLDARRPMGISSGIGSAQNDPPAENGTDGQRRPAPRVLEPNAAIAAAGVPESQDYSGPAVLSRSYTLSRPTLPRTIRWTPVFGFSSFYQVPVGPRPEPATPNALVLGSTYGTMMNWGISGTQAWRRDQVAVSYSGSASRYYQAGSFNGGNHNIGINFAHQLSRRFVVSLGQGIGITSQSYSLESSATGALDPSSNPNLAGTPSIGIYDRGTKQFSTSLQTHWQPTSRISVSMGSSVFFVTRGGQGFSGATGYQSQGEFSRRLSRKLTAGAFYSHSTYIFSKHTATSDSNGFGAILGYSFNQLTHVSLRLGMSQVESQSLTAVPLAPILAQILGQGSGIIQTYTRSRLQDIGIQASRTFRGNKNLSLAYAKGLAPGNGLIQTSSREALSGGFSMKIFRQYNLSVGGSMDRLSAIDRTGVAGFDSAPRTYSNKSIQFDISRAYRHGISSNFSISYRKAGGTTANFGYGDLLRISSGVSWGGRNGHLW